MDKAHMTALESKHQSLESRIEAEERRPQPDEAALAELKKRKLLLKDTLASG